MLEGLIFKDGTVKTIHSGWRTRSARKINLAVLDIQRDLFLVARQSYTPL